MDKGRGSDNIPMIVEELRENNIRYEDIIDSIPIGMLIFRMSKDETIQILSVNDRLVEFANQLHLSMKDGGVNWNKEMLAEKFKKDIYAFSNIEDIPKVKDHLDVAMTNGFSDCIFQLKGTEGDKTIWIKTLCASKAMDDESTMMYTLFQNYTQQVVYEKKLKEQKDSLVHISHYDIMTNIQNRYSYHLFLSECKQNKLKNTGILFADINGLKYINDTYGHNYGDSFIVEFGELLKKHFDEKGLYRISGDEFIAIVTDISDTEFNRKMQSFIREVNKIHIASVGYVWEPVIQDVKQEIFKAEQIMHIQKRQYYADINNSKFNRYRPGLINKLIQELEEKKFFIVLQPKADIHSTEVIGAEALIRKRGENGEMIPPYEFVPLLEKEMLISKVDFFVLEEVCKLLRNWKQTGKRLIRISVNLSRVTIVENDLIEHILRICKKYDVDHKYIEFEITESTETKDERKLSEVVKALHDQGFSISLDDMGNDYSSIKMLTLKEIDIVKLDRSFILGMSQKEGSALVRYIIALCHEIGKKCIAEGVENKEQQDILAEMNCDYYQGYLLNRPIAVDTFEQYLCG